MVFLLLRAEALQPRRVAQVRLWKPLATMWLIVIALASLAESPRAPLYTALIGIGLVFSLIGDWLLIDADAQPRRFVMGLAAFLFAHVTYVFAFAFAQYVRQMPLDLSREGWLAVALFVASGVVYLYLRPSLGVLSHAVLLYITVISLMVHRAASGVVVGGSLVSQSAFAAGGALLFYVSDFILAINKFIFGGDGGSNSVWVLTTYYSAQLLIALSASLL